MSWCADCVSQVAYRLPALSVPSAPSIHHSVSDTVPADGPSLIGVDHVAPPSRERVKYSWPGLSASVVACVGNAWKSTSMVPFGWTRIGARSAPPSGKCGLIGATALQVLPPSVEVWRTALRSPAVNEQLPIGEQTNFSAEALGP